LNAYFIYRIRKNKQILPLLKKILNGCILAEILLYFIGFFFRKSLAIEWYALIQKMDGFWGVFSLYLVTFLFFFDILQYLNSKGKLPFRLKKNTISVFVITCAVAFFAYIGSQMQTSKDNYVEPKIEELSISYDSRDSIPLKTHYKLLLVSDIHLGYIIHKKTLQKQVSFINAQNADIIVINGDLVDYYLEALEEQKMDEELKKLYAPQGVYFIPGNHEYKIDAEKALDWISRTGITVLRDSIVEIDERWELIGRDDRKNKDNRMAWDDLMAKTDSTKFRVLATHQPNDINGVIDYDIPLILCGHTHGGQFFPVNLFLFLEQKNPYGVKMIKQSFTYTTSGLGLSGFPFRISSHSEAVIFNIEIY
jgi:predicted MPP superfamily phosphohydrolase